MPSGRTVPLGPSWSLAQVNSDVSATEDEEDGLTSPSDEDEGADALEPREQAAVPPVLSVTVV